MIYIQIHKESIKWLNIYQILKVANKIIQGLSLDLSSKNIHIRLIIQYIRIIMDKVYELTQDYDDIYAGLSQQILKNMYIRFYTMEQYFQFSTVEDQQAMYITQNNSEQKMQAQDKKVLPVSMIFNKIIQQCIVDLNIMNKLIASKSRNVTSILDNGKSDHWKQFINLPQFGKIKQAYALIKSARKNIIKYSVLSISNLFLKLSINMSKISIIPIQKLINFQSLNIPTLSVIFLQFMQYKLYKSKNILQQQQASKINFLKQLPRITFIKFSKYKCNTDIELLQTSQNQFVTKLVKQSIRNMQFIHIHEQSIDPVLPQYARKTNYQHFYVIDLQKLAKGAIKAPYTFQILQIMRLLVFPQIRDFRPDLIIYLESFPNQTPVMDDQIRALMLCQMAQQTTCNKMYVMKQLGFDKFKIKQYAQLIKKTQQMSESSLPKGQQICAQINKIFESEQSKIANKYINKFLNAEDKKYYDKIKKVFINEMCYTSLALIQKTSFDRALQKSHKFFHKQQLLKGIAQEIQSQYNRLQKSQQNLRENLKVHKEQVRMMLQVLKFKKQEQKIKKGQNSNNGGIKIINLTNRETQFKSFYNLLEQRTQKIQYQSIVGQQIKIIQLTFTEQDYFIVKYFQAQKRLLIILIKNNLITRSANKNNQMMQVQQMYPYSNTNTNEEKFIKLIILSKNVNQKYYKKQREIQLPAQQHFLQDPIYVCSNDYLYRGFGKFKIKTKANESSQGFNSAIHRFKLYPDIGNEWQLVGKQGIPKQSSGKQQKPVNLQKKVYGYGIYDIDNKNIMMMGGYIDSSNQERISKNIFFIKYADAINGKQASSKINILGKTNKIVYTTSTQKIKDILLYPFIFGIPFYVSTAPGQKGSAFVLNSNGYFLNLNLSNKIFTSQIKLSQIQTYNGINVQNKLSISKDVEQAATSIFLSQVLIKCTVLYPHQINLKGDMCCVQTLQQGEIIMKANMVNKNILVKAQGIFEDSQWRKIQFI